MCLLQGGSGLGWSGPMGVLALGGGAWSRGGVPGTRGACSGGPGPGGMPARGVWSWGVWSQGVPGGEPPGTATAAGGTHPTGMHSCLKIYSSSHVLGAFSPTRLKCLCLQQS